jgi:hypothetical protein
MANVGQVPSESGDCCNWLQKIILFSTTLGLIRRNIIGARNNISLDLVLTVDPIIESYDNQSSG